MHLPNPVTHRSIDQVEQCLMQQYRRIDANEYQALVDLREYDIRQGWKAWHLNNCAEFLNLKCGISKGAAWEKVRVAHALLDLPQCSRAMEEGRLSFCKARAVTRLATPLNEKELLDFAESRPTSVVEDYCRHRRNAQRRESTDEVNRIHRNRYLSCIHDENRSVIHAELTREAAELVMKAIEIAMETDRSDGHLDEEENFFARQADALVDLARSYLDGGTDKASSTADRYQVMIHIDEAVLRGETGKSDLPVESVRRLLCDGSVVPIIEDENGDPLNVGRKHRIVTTSQRRALQARDKECRYPGCSHTKWLQSHHVVNWADGGETNLGNTLLLCSKHHHLLHEGGYEIRKDYRGNWYFVTSTGRTIPEAPMFKSDDHDAATDAIIDVETDAASSADSSRDESPVISTVAGGGAERSRHFEQSSRDDYIEEPHVFYADPSRDEWYWRPEQELNLRPAA